MHKYTEVQPPCHICTSRHMGCHSECKAYEEFRRGRDANSKQKVQAYEVTSFVIGTQEKIKRQKRHAKRK